MRGEPLDLTGFALATPEVCPPGSGVLREGVDFSTQADLRHVGFRSSDFGIGTWDLGFQIRNPNSEIRNAVAVVVADWALGELEMVVWTGELPGGVAWTEQVWWRVELWTAFWRARDEEVRRVMGEGFWATG